MTQKTLIVEVGRAFFASDIWDAVSIEDRSKLVSVGFGPNLTAQQWAAQINGFMSDTGPSATLAPDEESIIMLRELPVSILKKGVVGTNGTYHFQPEFMLHAIVRNKFVFDLTEEKDKRESNFGNVHIHSLVNKMGELERSVANIVGAELVRRNPSPPDIMHQRASNDIFGKISLRYGNREFIRSMYTFGGIITVDGEGQATGIRWCDFYKSGLDLQRLVTLNDAAYDSLHSDSPSASVIADYYRFMDSVTTIEMPDYVGGAL